MSLTHTDVSIRIKPATQTSLPSVSTAGVSQMSDRDRVPPRVRELVIEQHDHECVLCAAVGPQRGGDATLHLHHRRAASDGGTNDADNLVPLCEECHHHHHSSRTAPGEVQANLDDYDLSTTPADYKLLDAIDAVGPAPPGELATEAGISTVHARRRLYALAAADLVARNVDGYWDFVDEVENPVRGRLPDDPERAARFARDDVIRRMCDAGMAHADIADIVGLDERTIPVAANRARAFDPPVPPCSPESEPDLSDLARRVASIERQLDAN